MNATRSTLALRPLLAAAAGDLAELLFPRVCLVCSRLMARGNPAFVCTPCWARVTPLGLPQCMRCGHPRRRPQCQWCELVIPEVSTVRSWCWANDPMGERIVHALKYDGWRNLADEIAARMARLDFGGNGGPQRRVLVPVPLAIGRRKERGYNQSECLAQSLAARWRATCCPDLVQRIRETPTQTRLTPEQRLHNVADAFQVAGARVAGLGNAAFFLVDDVITTGATLNACAKALTSAGARHICYITFGRARDPRDAPPSRGTTPHGHSGRH